MRTAILKSLPLALSLLLAGSAHAQLKLAVAGPVTGANAAFGAQLTQGLQQAAEDINKAGGILGQKIEVEIGDDVSDPKQGVSVANKFVGDGVKFVVGHFNSGVTMPASDVYAENGVLFITPSATNPKMWGGLHTEGGLILRQMRDQGMNTIMISGDGITDSEFASIGGPGVEGTLMTFGPEPRNNPNAKAAVDSFKTKGFDPQGYTLYSYAAVQIFKQAAEKANSLDPKKVAEVMHSGMPFHTVIGDISYDKKGDRTTVDYVWYVWKKDADGKIGFVQL
jgi:ABC-type branched-subunit amino acid transport system substrate-binding protein